MNPRVPSPLVALCLGCAVMLMMRAEAAEAPSSVTVRQLEGKVRFEIAGSLFTEYVYQGTPKPYLFPVVMADGTALTREYPMASPAGEEHDHPHHRSVWFGHGDVNGHDFWLEPSEKPDAGRILTEPGVEASGGPVGRLHARNRWVLRDDSVVCTDDTMVVVGETPSGRYIDYTISVHADHGPLVFGDTKEGAMAIRLAPWMCLTHPDAATKKPHKGAGSILNSAGDRDANAWGKRADWVDYSAPHGGQVYGVAILEDPANPRHPTWWHVRDYGLFAANPFGRHDFEKLKDAKAGDYTVPAGATATFRYRFVFHKGDAATAAIPALYTAFTSGR